MDGELDDQQSARISKMSHFWYVAPPHRLGSIQFWRDQRWKANTKKAPLRLL